MLGRKRVKLTAKNAKWYALLFAAVGVFAIILAISSAVSAARLKSRCSEKASGTVVSTDSRYVHKRRGSYTEYSAQIEFSNGDDSGTLSVKRDGKPFAEGDSVLVYYDPNDLTVAYEASTPPDSGIGGFVFGVVFIGFGAFYWKAHKAFQQGIIGGNDNSGDSDIEYR